MKMQTNNSGVQYNSVFSAAEISQVETQRSKSTELNEVWLFLFGHWTVKDSVYIHRVCFSYPDTWITEGGGGLPKSQTHRAYKNDISNILW